MVVCGKFCGLRGQGYAYFVKDVTKCDIAEVFWIFEAEDSKGVMSETDTRVGFSSE